MVPPVPTARQVVDWQLTLASPASAPVDCNTHVLPSLVARICGPGDLPAPTAKQVLGLVQSTPRRMRSLLVNGRVGPVQLFPPLVVKSTLGDAKNASLEPPT